MKRLAGLETEFGCLAPESFGPPAVPTRVRDYLFKKKKLGLIDQHDRDYDEPAGNGGFLFNGGRLYLDMGHVEFCTPECLNLADVVAYDQAGECLLQQALDELGLADEVSFLKNNIDHYTSATFGCHENYLLQRNAPLTQSNVDTLLAFLATRILLIGSGRVGVTLAPRRYGKADNADNVPFQVSQRADFIQTDIYEWVQFNRALINARDEPLADYRRFRRLHLLLGDSNLLPFSNALKVGSTSLVLDLLEADALPKLALVNPVQAMRHLSHHPNGPWVVELEDGRDCSALDVLEEFLKAATSGVLDLDADGKWTVAAWTRALDALRHDRERLIGKVDWITKQFLLQSFVDSEKVNWRDPWLESLDLEYHQLNPHKTLLAGLPGTALEKQGLAELAKRDYFLQPPTNTRASLRSEAMRLILHKKLPYVIDWDLIYIGEGRQLQLDDPFDFNTKALSMVKGLDDGTDGNGMAWLYYALGAAIIWGVNYAVSGRLLERGLSAPTLFFIDCLFGACVAGALISFTGKWQSAVTELNAARSDLIWLIVALVAASSAGLLIFMSIEAKNATVASLIEVTYPLFTAFFAWAFFRQTTFNTATVIGAILIFAGVMIVAQGNR